MEGRHSAAERRRSRPVGVTPVVVGAAVVAFVVAIGLVIRWQTTGEEPASAATTCTESISVAAAPAIADAVADVVDSSQDRCGEYDIAARSAADVAESLRSDEDVPDVWIPESTIEVDRVAGDAATAPVVLEASIASSPIVVVSSQEPASSWSEVLGGDSLDVGDPTSSMPSVLALVASRAEAKAAGASDDEIKQAMVSVAQFGSSGPDGSTTGERIKNIASNSGTTVASEQAVTTNDAAKDLHVYVPDSGTLALDYPLVLSASADERKTRSPAIDALTAILTSADAHEMFAAAGFRSPDGASIDGGVGEVKSSPLPPSDDVAALIGAWTLLSRPSRTLAVIDVSGSMQYAAGDSSRMALAIEAAQEGQRLFPDDSSLGLWAFSVGLGKDGKDYLPLVPIRPLGTKIDGTTQRAVVEQATASLIERTGGGTGLYDSVLAAYREVQKGYDPKAVNSVVLLTDGENEDPGSITLDKLLDTLESEADPDRPVVIVAIGITDDADESALEAIAHVTGGSSHIAVEPDDIANVFIEALANRGTTP